MSIAKMLTALGPRLAGTPANEQAARLLAQAFSERRLAPVLQPFTFTGWQHHQPAQLTMLAPMQAEIPCAAMLYSGAGTVTGFLQPAGRRPVIGVFEWESFDIIDASGAILGTLIQREEGSAIPQCLDAPSEIPSVIVGSDWLHLLGGVDPAEILVELRTHCSLVPNSVSHNVITSREASTEAEILVCSHYDTVYNSPGANDNASGTDVVLRLAAMGFQHLPDINLRYAVFSGEEWVLLGSQAYVASRQQAGNLSSLKLVLNIDMVGKGEFLWLSVTDETEGIVRQAVNEVAPEYKATYQNPPIKGDHYPFYEEGIPSIMLLWWPDEVYHTPADTIDTLSEDRLALSTRLAARIIELGARYL